MNYKKIHDKIIERAKDRNIEGYTEKHHIIPKCMGGTDDTENLVELTAREHFVVHKLLCEIYPDENGLRYALWMMANVVGNGQYRDYIIGSWEYARLKKKMSKIRCSKVLAKNENGHITLVSKEKFKKSDNLVGAGSGFVVARDKNGDIHYVPTDDERFDTGDLVGNNKGMINVKDDEGNRFYISVDNPLYKSGKLKPLAAGRNVTQEEILHKKKIQKGQFTLEWFQNKYGERVGTKKYNDRCDRKREAMVGKNNPNAKKVQCLQENCCDNRIFDTAKECGEFHNLTSVDKHCRNVYPTQKFKYI